MLVLAPFIPRLESRGVTALLIKQTPGVGRAIAVFETIQESVG
jgi:hypothetical protein